MAVRFTASNASKAGNKIFSKNLLTAKPESNKVVER